LMPSGKTHPRCHHDWHRKGPGIRARYR
jgi:hypothetical protein